MRVLGNRFQSRLTREARPVHPALFFSVFIFLLALPANVAVPIALILASVLLFSREKKADFRKFFFLDFSNPARTLVASAGLFAATFLLLFALNFVLFLAGLADSGKVIETVARQPLVVLASAVLLAPVAEELFFRGYLLRKAGALFSSAAFSASHLFWGSFSELAAALAVGLLFSLFVQKNKSLVPCIAAHAAYNLFSISYVILLSKPAGVLP